LHSGTSTILQPPLALVTLRLAVYRLSLLPVLALLLTACAAMQPRDPHTFEALAEASLPRAGLTREMLKVIGEVAREGALALVLQEVGREQGFDETWQAGNRYYDRAAAVVERSMEPMLSRMDPTPLLERNLTRSLERHLNQDEARQLVEILATPDGRRFTEYLDASMAAGMFSGVASRTPAPFRALMAQRLETLRPRLEAARTSSVLSAAEQAQMTQFSGSRLGRKLGRAYLAWADSLRGEWSADLRPRTQQVKDNLLRSADDLRTILHEYEQWRSGELRDA
jgi:hypothetical protein